MNELEIASTESLIDELGRRLPAVVIAFINLPKIGTKGGEFCMYRNGDTTTCWGLVSRLKAELIRYDLATTPQPFFGAQESGDEGGDE